MQVIALVAAILALEIVPSLGYVYSTQSICKTLMGSSSTNPVKTSSYAITIPITFQKKTTVTPTSTITPAPVSTTTTTTTTTTVVVNTTPTSIFTHTNTETDISTTFTTITSTEIDTATTTSVPPATTVPTSAGFTPLASGIGYAAKKRSVEEGRDSLPAIRGRAIEQRAPAQRNRIRCPVIGSPGQFSPAQYPTSVVCGALIQAITTTTKSFTATTVATTTLPAATNTITSTQTNTATSTSVFAAVIATVTTTMTVSTTTTLTTSTTTTISNTQTVVAPTPTVYDACSANNVVGAANGNTGIYVINYAAYNNIQLSSIDNSDPTQCCINCQTTANCVGYGQYPGGACYIFTNPGTCNGASSFDDNYQTNAGLPAGAGYFVGNGQCGQLQNGGVYGG